MIRCFLLFIAFSCSFASASSFFNLKYDLVFDNPPSVLYVGQNFTIKINTTVPITQSDPLPSIKLDLSCSGILIQSWLGVIINQPNILTLNTNTPLTNCFLTTPQVSPYYNQASLSIIEEKGTVSFTSPNNLAFFAAGSQVPITLTSIPVTDNFTVQLACNSTQVTTYSVTSGTNLLYLIPSSFYGDVCTLSVIAPLDKYIPSNSVNITVTQQLSFVEPISGQNVTSPAVIPIFLATGDTVITTLILAQLQCDSTSSTVPFNFYTSSNFDLINYSTEYYGNCSVSVTSAPDYFLKPVAAIFSIKFDLVFDNPPTVLYVGQNFTITINTTIPITQSDPLPSIELDLSCSGIFIQSWSNVIINQPNLLALTSDTIPNFGCYLSTPIDSSFYNPTFCIVSDAEGAVLFISPQNFTLLAAGSYAPIALISSPVSDVFIVQLACNSTQMQNYTVPSNVSPPQSFMIPFNFYGTNCIFSVISLLNKYIPLYSVIFTVTQQLAYVNPTFEEVITNSSPITIFVTTGYDSITALITAKISCGDIISDPFDFFTLNEFNYMAYTTEYYGLCNLNIITAPGFFVKPAAVNFYIKFDLEFTYISPVIYVALTFTVQINTLVSITQSTPIPTTRLDLYCAGSIVESWQNVLINQANTLTLKVDAVQKYGCYLQTPSDSPDYNQVIIPVIVQSYISPAGPLIYLSPVQLENFLQSFGSSATW